MEIKTTSIHFNADQKLLLFIDKKVGKLNQYFDRIIDTNVYLKLENSGQVRDKIVELKVNVPGDTLVATEKSNSFEAATDQVVDTMRRQLLKYKNRYKHRPA